MCQVNTGQILLDGEYLLINIFLLYQNIVQCYGLKHDMYKIKILSRQKMNYFSLHKSKRKINLLSFTSTF